MSSLSQKYDALKFIFRTLELILLIDLTILFSIAKKKNPSKSYFTSLLVHCLLQSIDDGINGKSR